jgi:aspartyl-tRNA(Asn)/glutamyl-tRNA(Gln) amidotransferase subunit C
MLTDKDISHVAALARIELDDAMRERVKNDLQSILEYIEVLNRVTTDDVVPLYQVTGQVNRTRADDHRGVFPMDEELVKLLVGQAPGHENGFIKVKSVMEKKDS